MLRAMSSAHDASGPLLYAHRGAPLEQPENTLEGFALALAAGADALELDVHMSRDGHVVVSHDADGLRNAGDARAITACTLAEIKQWDLAPRFGAQRCAGKVRVPALDEVLAAFPSARLNIDVKQSQPNMVPAVLAAIARHAAHARVLLTSFSSVTTRALHAAGYAGDIGLGRGEAVRAVFVPELLQARARGGARLQIPLRYGPLSLDRASLIAKMHRRGIAVDYWVVNDIAQAERLLELGADGIVTDDARAMASLFARSPRTSGWRARHPMHTDTRA
jgi:glycerophosphoryl diester phosphodiesterase